MPSNISRNRASARCEHLEQPLAVGRYSLIAAKIAAGFGWPGSSSEVAPAQNGKVTELPKP
jgi:hypothetical protein